MLNIAIQLLISMCMFFFCTYQVFAVAHKWGFNYVENFVWVKKTVNNKFYSTDYKYFRKSKLTLLIFRKPGLLAFFCPLLQRQ